MNNTNSYQGYRYPAEMIAHAVWLYHRFTLSFRDINELLAERGINVTHETTRQWRMEFDQHYANTLRIRCEYVAKPPMPPRRYLVPGRGLYNHQR